MTFRRLAGHLLAFFSVASMLSAVTAAMLRPFFHGYFDDRTQQRVTYFDFGIFHWDYRWMLAAFVFVFIVVPILLGLRLAIRTPEPQFEHVGGFVGSGLLLLVGLFLNLYIGLSYVLAGYNSSDPF